ncbi:DUF4302 domain-containing protein [Dyadobacter sediminis]|uniref:DUF4302 domain-containing protein n=1 Tax=Dyadobacter sediminis TaxID=1493691 RepID=A0A5R9KA20_9BACT|nr:DUF4302 domain-containing protein [Dyadobacter sediminis]TLU91646.1 DUF4302 domain-containing protein [Dyadobacter sediminis]GGC01599.1 hypothetical protein GCM10011325_30940 [Dyadobacter sediminis]
MKKSILYLLFLSTAFFSCENKDDTVFEETADVRINAALASYEKQLVEAPYGWNAVVYPALGGSYGFYFKFDDKNRVVMYSDFSNEAAATSKESSYRLKAMQTPTLIFDTYSYLHVLADPDRDVNGGVTGVGLGADFEFSIFPDSVKTDVISLVGRKNQSRLVLTKATQEQSAAYLKGDLAKGLLFNNIEKYQTYFKRVTLGGVAYEITANPIARTMKLTWLDGNAPKTFTTNYYYTSSGIAFVSPLTNGAQTISGFSNITWNAATLQLGVSAGGSTAIVQSAAKPLSVDAGAAKRWWQSPIESGGEWRSDSAFHVNGADDAYNVSSLKVDQGFYVFYVYQPGINPKYDLFGPAFVVGNALTLEYADAPATPTFAADGRIIFTKYGTFGEFPKTGPAVSTSNLLFDTSGYYMVQTSATTYDMISAKDAKSWISWYR